MLRAAEKKRETKKIKSDVKQEVPFFIAAPPLQVASGAPVFDSVKQVEHFCGCRCKEIGMVWRALSNFRKNRIQISIIGLFI